MGLIHLTLFAPFVAFLLIGLVFYRHSLIARIISVVLSGVSAVGATLLLIRFWHLAEPLQISIPWLSLPKFTLEMGIYLDSLSLLMLFLVSFISFLIQVYSCGYMDQDPGKSRFFAYLSFFSGSMMVFVISTNLIQAYIFWELFGLASYLLIGFWYHKPEAAKAARKAFIMTRVGDAGFLIGIILLLLNVGSVDYSLINDPKIHAVLSHNFLMLVGVLIFLGMVGKSAQFPLHAWLPDAMEGPTPVSALIHSATMVAAGVYLFARLHPFYIGIPEIMNLMLVIAAITAFIGAALACVQVDIKRILAYSTISQLGLMMMALAAGAYLGGIFHLTTHAFFKAMLFMCAGVLIHQFQSNNLYTIAERGGSTQRWILFALLTGCLALAGIFPLSGFFSKDLIMEHLLHHPNAFFPIWVSLVNFLTAYYAFKIIFVLLFPKQLRLQEKKLAPSSLSAMLSSIIILTLLTIGVGWLITPVGGNLLPRFLSGEEGGLLEWSVVLTGTLVAILGGTLAYLDVRMSPWRESVLFSFLKPFQTLLQKKFYIDIFYDWISKTLMHGSARTADWIDRNVVDGAVNGMGQLTVFLGRSLSNIQNGAFQFYLHLSVGITLLLMLYLTFFT